MISQGTAAARASLPPPSSGGTHVAQILNILSNFDLVEMEKKTRQPVFHTIAEAMRLAFADRAFSLSNPDFVKVPEKA